MAGMVPGDPLLGTGSTLPSLESSENDLSTGTVKVEPIAVNVSTKTETRVEKPRKTGPGKLPDFAQGRKVLSVASKSPVKQVAGSIAHTTRGESPPVLSAVGPKSVNQAIKSIAIARNYLENDKIDLLVEVVRGDGGGEIKDLILLNLKKIAKVPTDGLEFQSLKSASKSAPSALAGAIAKYVRENNNVKITAVGQDPVFRAVDAIASARKYLTDDKLDLQFRPEFTQVTFPNGTEANGLQFLVTYLQVE